MRLFKQFLIVVMVIALALPLLCACGDSENQQSEPDNTDNSVGNSTSTDNNGPVVREDVPPEIKDLNGREINVICWDWSAGSNSILGFTGEVISNAESDPSAVDIAKQAVIDLVEQEYNVNIGGWVTNDNSYFDEVRKMVTTGTYSYDLVFGASGHAATQMTNGYLTDLKTIPTIDLENSWWDQNAVEDLSLGGRLFWVCGDINTYDNLGTWCVLFNKNLKSTLGIEEDFYKMASDGTWTLDAFMELCQGVTQEYDGVTGIDEYDLWACGTEKFNVFAHLVGAGMHVVEKNDEDLPYLTIRNQTERTYAALDKVIKFYTGDDVMVANGGKYDNKGYSNVWEATVHKAFVEGRELFYICGLINVASFRSMKDEFGILPMPKTFAEQDSYYHTVSAGNSSYMTIPYGVPGVEDLGLVVEALAMKSQEMVTPEFYEMQLKGRDTRDDESADMLDIIFSTRSFDLAPIFNWGGIMNCFYTIDTNYASRFESLADGAKMAIESTMDIINAYVEAE